jgi:hypothetical protein
MQPYEKGLTHTNMHGTSQNALIRNAVDFGRDRSDTSTMAAESSLERKQAAMRKRAARTSRMIPVPKPEVTQPIRAYATKTSVFNVRGRPFTSDSNAGTFLDSLIALCADPPEYLHPRDAERYLYLLPILRGSTFHDSPKSGAVENVADGTIADLCRFGGALEDWVTSYYARRTPVVAHTLMPHFALDAAELVLAHAYGNRFCQGDWYLQAMVPDLKENGFLSPQFKADFTRATGYVYAKGIVPEDASILRRTYQETLSYFMPGDEFCFRIERCHLSEGFYDNEVFSCEETKPRPYDLRDNFKFFGSLLVSVKAGRGEIRTEDEDGIHEYGLFQSLMPARWITHGKKDEAGRFEPTPWKTENDFRLVKPK